MDDKFTILLRFILIIMFTFASAALLLKGYVIQSIVLLFIIFIVSDDTDWTNFQTY